MILGVTHSNVPDPPSRSSVPPQTGHAVVTHPVYVANPTALNYELSARATVTVLPLATRSSAFR
jgi:hypothetical protein